jgi:hypothetical protein
MSSYARYCQTQATHCARRAKLASSPDVKAYHRRLGLQWLKLAEKARVASGRTRPLHARIDLRDRPPGSGSACTVAEQRSENLPQRQPGEAGKKAAPGARVLQSAFRAGHYIAVTAFVVMLFMVVT